MNRRVLGKCRVSRVADRRFGLMDREKPRRVFVLLQNNHLVGRITQKFVQFIDERPGPHDKTRIFLLLLRRGQSLKLVLPDDERRGLRQGRVVQVLDLHRA